MAWKKFAKLRSGTVDSIVVSQLASIYGHIDVTGIDAAQVGADYDADTDTFGEPEPELKMVVKAIYLTFKANPGVTIPPKAQAIFQRLKASWNE